MAFPTDSPEAVAARPVLKAPVEVLTAFDVVAMARNCRSTGGYGHGAIRDPYLSARPNLRFEVPGVEHLGGRCQDQLCEPAGRVDSQ